MEAVLARIAHILIAVGGAYFLALWFALVVWTFRDIQERSRSVIAQIFSTLVVVLFSVPGVLLYLLLRPRETLDDAFERSLQEEYLLQDMEGLALCPHCERVVGDDFLYCPYCRAQLRLTCHECGRPVDVRWAICPYCGVEQETIEAVPAPAPSRALPDLGRLAQRLRHGAVGGMFPSDGSGRALEETRPAPPSLGARRSSYRGETSEPGAVEPDTEPEETSEIPPVPARTRKQPRPPR